MDPLIIWAIVCLTAALILFAVEMFIPAGGTVGFAAALCLIAGVVLLFLVNPVAGLVGAIVVLACVPFVFALVVRIWPDTPVARWLTLRTSLKARTGPGAGEDDENPGTDESVEDRKLIGVVGSAVTDLRPVGVCLLEGQRRECMSEGGVVRAGRPVKVVAVDGMELKVREVLEG